MSDFVSFSTLIHNIETTLIRLLAVGNKIDIQLISETKLDDTLPLCQFILEGFTPPYRLHITESGGGLMLFIREDIPSKLLPNVNPSGNIENIFVKIN